jgi:hypothetical protein
MGQQNGKQQTQNEEEMKNGNNSIVVKLPLKSRHRRLSLEMECEIFKFFKLPIQLKFFQGMGRGIYRIFGQNVLIKVNLYNCFAQFIKII